MAVNKEMRAGLPCPNSSASFWHSEPNQYLLYHQTTRELPEHADIVIIGSGITGSAVARFLAEDPRAKGSSVCMLEAREACWGATGRNGGHCQALVYERNADIAQFEIRNVAAVKSYIETHSIPCEWRTVTACRTYWSKELMAATENEISKLKAERPEIGKLVRVIKDPADLAKHRVSKHAAGATLTEGAGGLWPYKYVTFILERLVKEGKLNLQTNTPVESISAIRSTSSSFRWNLKTSRGNISARHLILATNGYTSHLLPQFAPIIVPVRCEMSALVPPTGSTRLPNSYGFTGVNGNNPEHDDYLIQRPFTDSESGEKGKVGGHLMFGGGRGQAEFNCIGEWEDNVIDQGEAAYLRKTLLQVLSLGGDVDGMKELPASHQWTGIKGYSRDNMPWVGKVPDTEGLWLCGGYTGHGMPNGTLCGKAIVEMALAEQSGDNLEEVFGKLISDGELPKEYLITPERMKRALELPSVEVQDAAGIVGPKDDELVKGNEDSLGAVKVKDSKCVTI